MVHHQNNGDSDVSNLRTWISRHRLAWGLIVVVLFALLRAAQTLAWRQGFGALDFPTSWPFTVFLLLWFVILAVVLVGGGLVWLPCVTWVQLGWRRSGLLKAIGWGVLGFVLLYLNVIVWAVFKGATAQPALLAPSPWRLALVVFFAFGIAAWVEENLYRGYLQPLLVGRFGLPVAVVVQAALFALAHLGYYRQALDFGMAFVAGLILGWLRKRDGSLVAPYVAHGLFWLMAAFMAVAA